MTNLAKKERKRMVRSFLRLKKNVLFCNIYLYIYTVSLYIYIYLYISIYIHIYQYIYQYIYKYILKKKRGLGNGHAFFSKECNVLHSFAKEHCVLCILFCSLQKNVALFAFFYILKKRMQKNASSFWV